MDYFGLWLNNVLVDSWCKGVVSWMWCIKVLMYFEIELMGIVCECVEDEVINVFVCNLYDLLMVVFVGLCVMMGFDSGLCIGVKVVVVDGIGKLVVMDIIYLYIGQVVKVVIVIVVLCEKYYVELVVIGNGMVLCEIECFYFDV